MKKRVNAVLWIILLKTISFDFATAGTDVYWSAWNGGDPTGWTTPWNWGRANPPTAAENAVINPNVANQPQIRAGMNAVADWVWIHTWDGHHGVSSLTITGGTLVANEIRMGPGSGTMPNTDHAYLNISGGEVNVKSLYVGQGGTGNMNTMNMSGGMVNVSDFFTIPGFWSQGSGMLNLSGGVINVGKALKLQDAGGSGKINITGGQINVVSEDNYFYNLFTQYKLQGLIYNSQTGVVNITYDVSTGITSINTVPEPATLLLMGLGGMLAFRKKQ